MPRKRTPVNLDADIQFGDSAKKDHTREAIAEGIRRANAERDLAISLTAAQNAAARPKKKRAPKSSPFKNPIQIDDYVTLTDAGLFDQGYLDDLLKLSPSQNFEALADILDPSPNATNYSEWVTRNLPDAFYRPLGPHQHYIFDMLAAQPHGLRLAVGAPRGAGKSVLALFGLPLATIALGTHQFIAIIASTQLRAESHLNSIRAELERRPDLAERWPNLRFVPAPKSTRRHRVDTSKEIQLVGGRIVAVGAGARVRGLNRETPEGKFIRPDLFILDDFETENSARSGIQTDRLEEWIFASLLGLGSSQRPITAIMINTTLSADSVMARALKNKGRFGPWTTRAFPIYTTDSDGKQHLMWPDFMPWAYVRALTDPNSDQFIGTLTFYREYMLSPQDVVGALWTEQVLKECRFEDECPSRDWFQKIYIGVDPSWGTKGDECGIVVVGLGPDKYAYILEDLSIRDIPAEWGRTVANAFHRWRADKVVVEAAFGAEDVKFVMETVDPTVPITPVSVYRGKTRRMEPVATLYEHKKVKHIGFFPDLERQMLEYVEGQSHYSPDHIDAMVWAVGTMMLGNKFAKAQFLSPPRRRPQDVMLTGRGNLSVIRGGRSSELDRSRFNPQRSRVVW